MSVDIERALRRYTIDTKILAPYKKRRRTRVRFYLSPVPGGVRTRVAEFVLFGTHAVDNALVIMRDVVARELNPNRGDEVLYAAPTQASVVEVMKTSAMKCLILNQHKRDDLSDLRVKIRLYMHRFKRHVADFTVIGGRFAVLGDLAMNVIMKSYVDAELEE